jgi:hypothetical protein
MLYTKIQNDQAVCPAVMLDYFVTQGDIDSVDATEEQLAAANIVLVTAFTGQAPVDGNEYGVEIQQQTDGSWAHELVQKTISEQQFANNVAVQAKAVKADRDRMIAGTDWIVTKAAEEGTAVSQEWKTYRQALRDIPLQEGFPFTVTWPTRP